MAEKTIAALKEAIKETEERIFYIDMIDTWTTQDRIDNDRLHKKLRTLKKELKEYESGVKSETA